MKSKPRLTKAGQAETKQRKTETMKYEFEVVLKHKRWRSKSIWEKKTGYSEVVEIPEEEIKKRGLLLAVSHAAFQVADKWRKQHPKEVAKAEWYYSCPGWYTCNEKKVAD